jgi:hypothetical protein
MWVLIDAIVQKSQRQLSNKSGKNSFIISSTRFKKSLFVLKKTTEIIAGILGLFV